MAAMDEGVASVNGRCVGVDAPPRCTGESAVVPSGLTRCTGCSHGERGRCLFETGCRKYKHVWAHNHMESLVRMLPRYGTSNLAVC